MSEAARTLGISRKTAPSVTGRVSPMCPVRSVTYVVGRTCPRKSGKPTYRRPPPCAGLTSVPCPGGRHCRLRSRSALASPPKASCVVASSWCCALCPRVPNGCLRKSCSAPLTLPISGRRPRETDGRARNWRASRFRVNALASRPGAFVYCGVRTHFCSERSRARRSRAVGQRRGAAECLADARGGLPGWSLRASRDVSAVVGERLGFALASPSHPRCGSAFTRTLITLQPRTHATINRATACCAG